MAEYIPDPADVELVRNAWRNAPCSTCHRQRACRCIVEDHDLRDYRARAVLAALADAGRLRAEANAPGGVFCADEAELDAALNAIPPADAEEIQSETPIPYATTGPEVKPEKADPHAMIRTYTRTTSTSTFTNPWTVGGATRRSRPQP